MEGKDRVLAWTLERCATTPWVLRVPFVYENERVGKVAKCSRRREEVGPAQMAMPCSYAAKPIVRTCWRMGNRQREQAETAYSNIRVYAAGVPYENITNRTAASESMAWLQTWSHSWQNSCNTDVFSGV